MNVKIILLGFLGLSGWGWTAPALKPDPVQPTSQITALPEVRFVPEVLFSFNNKVGPGGVSLAMSDPEGGDGPSFQLIEFAVDPAHNIYIVDQDSTRLGVFAFSERGQHLWSQKLPLRKGYWQTSTGHRYSTEDRNRLWNQQPPTLSLEELSAIEAASRVEEAWFHLVHATPDALYFQETIQKRSVGIYTPRTRQWEEVEVPTKESLGLSDGYLELNFEQPTSPQVIVYEVHKGAKGYEHRLKERVSLERKGRRFDVKERKKIKFPKPEYYGQRIWTRPGSGKTFYFASGPHSNSRRLALFNENGQQTLDVVLEGLGSTAKPDVYYIDDAGNLFIFGGGSERIVTSKGEVYKVKMDYPNKPDGSVSLHQPDGTLYDLNAVGGHIVEVRRWIPKWPNP